MIFAALFAASIYWHLPFLVLAISLVYSATRYDQWDAILQETFRWALRMFLFMLAIFVVLFAVAWLLQPG
jgi:hypothetical protein